MLEKRVIVELSPSRLSAAVWHRGRVVSSAVERHDAARFRDDWSGAIQGLRPMLKEMVDTLGVAGRSATVVYHSPTAVCGVFSCPLSAGRSGWARAARLAVAEAASFPASENPVACTRLAVDATTGGAESPALAHTLGVADADGALELLSEWAVSSGLSPLGFVPAGAVSLWATVRRALSTASGGSALIALHIDEHASVLALGAGGRLKLVRQLGFGTELLAESLARALAGASTPSPSARGQARMILGTIGIPSKDQVVDAERGVTGAAVLPVLQPLLQRLLIEAKQSLRFGLTDSQRVALRLEITGPGAQVPGLGAVVAAQTGTALTASAGQGEGPIDPRRTGVVLVPRALRTRLHGRAAARGLWTGGAAAAAFIAYLCFDGHTELARVRARLAADRMTLAESADVSAMVAALTSAKLGLSDAYRRMDAAFAGTTDWSAVLTGLAEQTPDSISLGTIELSIDRDRPICRVRGLARCEPDADPATVVRAYVDRLTRLPIVRECRLGSTQRVDEDRQPRQTFILTLTLVDLPPTLAHAPEGPR